MNKKHSKFLTFVGDSSSDMSSFYSLAQTEVIKSGAAKSVGIEYLESQKKIILTVGYDDTETGYSVKIQPIKLGKLELNPAVISQAMEAAAATVDGVICHEFYVTEDGEFVMVVMTTV